MKLMPHLKAKIRMTPFGHFLDCDKIKINSTLLDDICGRWGEGMTFRFRGEDGKLLQITMEDVGLIFDIL